MWDVILSNPILVSERDKSMSLAYLPHSSELGNSYVFTRPTKFGDTG